MENFKAIFYFVFHFVILTTTWAAPSVPGSNMTTESYNISTTPPQMSPKEFAKNIEDLAVQGTKMLLPYFVRNSDLNLSPKCMSSFIKIFTDVRKLKAPAIKLLDSMAKPPPGILQGNFAIMGNYEQCLSISATKKGDVAKNRQEEFYHGRYCTVEINFPQPVLDALNDLGKGHINSSEFGKLASVIEEFPATNFANGYFKFQVGVCVPSTCSVDDLNEVTKSLPISFVHATVKRCESKAEEIVLTTDQAIILAILCLIVILVLVGTCLDAFFYVYYSTYDGNHKGKFIQFLLSFSIYKNTKQLLSSGKDPSGDIACIDGMYVTGTFLVIVYHTYFLPFFIYFTGDAANLGHFLKDVNFTLVCTMSISIEAYFLFSGLFLVYARFRRSGGKSAEVNLFKLLIRRYLRLCPSMLLIIALILVFPLVGSGPVWNDVFGPAVANAKKWWYTYAFMYNNFLETKDQSFLYFWFIPCLMQITIPGAILTWILSKCRKLGITLIVLTAVGCNVALAALTVIKHFPPSYAIYFFYNRDHFELTIYTGPLSHVSSFCIGMLLGYYMSTNPVIKWSKTQTVIGWIISFLLTVGVQYVLFPFHDGSDPNIIFSAFYGSTHKTAFALGMVWLILACTYGYGGVLGKILGWKGFGPLSKLGYLAYLIHYPVIVVHGSMARQTMVFNHYEVWIRIFSYTTLTFLAAYALYVCFELPLTFLESLFLPSRPTENVDLTLERTCDKNDELAKHNGIIITPENVSAVWNMNGHTRDSARKMVFKGEQSRL